MPETCSAQEAAATDGASRVSKLWRGSSFDTFDIALPLPLIRHSGPCPVPVPVSRLTSHVPTSHITAARLIGHRSINGKYQTKLKLDEFPVIGHQTTHSIDTFITDSANSASALYSGHKSTVNAMGGLGIFSRSNLPTWLDRNVYTENLRGLSNDPAGFGAHPDIREDFQVRENAARVPAVRGPGDYGHVANPGQAVDGFVTNGTIPTSESQGVHSLTDVMVYAMGPCQEIFGGTYDNTDVFYEMATCFGLGQPKNATPVVALGVVRLDQSDPL
ncbi:hypothetical protein SODALDRAFT_359149 [Sodiomyces alkalinus F11]|uniref:alkaline phosphatase n=1 Tax=Sodiomyces alkalinus (strain CBS 110278 / VKM F-3762 / F11) TaxID=1314773 RepID=A0A3N2PXN1_SODAK|nr:hypothetical protein SODALDRAFT_359149 [Sodiomyces alkalinus F11]ROT39271.1 hypothetical protein SODALDRAFT_359149 [Sodiomyces alkalinus F11]